MSEPQRRQVRVRRSPKISVFLGIGAVAGALVAFIAGAVAPQDSTTPREQAIGYLLLILAPLGAILGGAVALVLDRIADRRAKTVEAERIAPPAPAAEPDPAEVPTEAGSSAAEPAEVVDEAGPADRA
jgi:hypothetical protein